MGLDLDDHTVWARGVALGAERVVHLPGDEETVIGTVADAVGRTGPPATTIGVMPGRGGAGASTLSCALAFAAVRAGHRTVLVDADPLGGGLDILLGVELEPGARWSALHDVRGHLSSTDLEAALPRVGGLHLLSADHTPRSARPTAEAVRVVLDAARRPGGIVIVDLPRHVDEAVAETLLRLDLGLLVVPAGVRAGRAARRVVDGPGSLVPDLRLVRGPGGPGSGGEPLRPPGADLPNLGLSAAGSARSLGLPLAGEVPPEPGLAVRGELDEPPGAVPGGPLAGFCDGLLRRISPVRSRGPVPRPTRHPGSGPRPADRRDRRGGKGPDVTDPEGPVSR
ncbi:septum formation initiator [Streptomyces sp. ST2-7A]|nr:septum site-determining protein Ssd [Streptomyces sp. ST2-7A]MCE7080080.1 septum formation initiator [Streptomyces sp. ST2-7A]